MNLFSSIALQHSMYYKEWIKTFENVKIVTEIVNFF